MKLTAKERALINAAVEARARAYAAIDLIDWPSGTRQTLTNLPAGKIHTIREMATPQ